MRLISKYVGSFVGAFLIAPVAVADSYDVALLDNSGARISIGRMETESLGSGSSSYQIRLHAPKFESHFLSMRPFKCLPGEHQLWCHAEYPYEIKRTISATDWTDLEYDLIFVWKDKKEYGVDLWNGVYYQLEPLENGGWHGVMYEYDLGVLGVPPPAGELRPISETDLHETAVEDRAFPYLEISPISEGQ